MAGGWRLDQQRAEPHSEIWSYSPTRKAWRERGWLRREDARGFSPNDGARKVSRRREDPARTEGTGGTHQGRRMAGGYDTLDAGMGPKVPNLAIDLEVSWTARFQKAKCGAEKAEGATRQPLRFFVMSVLRGGVAHHPPPTTHRTQHAS
jgi:hypothetical protein